MESVVAYTDNSAVENFREYLRIKTVQPTPDYGIILVECINFFAFNSIAVLHVSDVVTDFLSVDTISPHHIIMGACRKGKRNSVSRQ